MPVPISNEVPQILHDAVIAATRTNQFHCLGRGAINRDTDRERQLLKHPLNTGTPLGAIGGDVALNLQTKFNHALPNPKVNLG